MKWLLLAVAALAVAVVAIAAIGALLPREHVASRTLRVRRTPQEIWPVITRLTAASSVPVDVLEQDPPRRLVTRVKESEKMFGGSAVTITENGWVGNPIFRFVSRFIIGHHATMDGILKELARQLNQTPDLT